MKLPAEIEISSQKNQAERWKTFPSVITVFVVGDILGYTGISLQFVDEESVVKENTPDVMTSHADGCCH